MSRPAVVVARPAAAPPPAPDAGLATVGPSALARAASWVAGLALLGLLAFVHLWQIDAVPRGLFVDESSIGLNGAAIAATGRDEFGVPWPVHFQSLGDYKSPLQIYTAALLIKLFGVSVSVVRATSVLYFGLFLLGTALLTQRLFPDRPAVWLYAVGAAGLLPWFFPFSRIAFEVTCQLALVTWAVLALHLTYAADNGRRDVPYAVLAGLALGLSTYSYQSARLLSPLLMVAAFATWPQPRYWRRHLALCAAFAVAMVPYATFALANPGALTDRFETVTYWGNPRFTLADNLGRFRDTYLGYFSQRFLFGAGDPNLRHGTAQTGALFVVVGALAVLGPLAWFARPAFRRGRFLLFAGLGLAVSPLAAALTVEPGAQRAIMAGLFLLLLSAYGFALLASASARPLVRTGVGAAVALGMAAQAGPYLYDYFTAYPARSENDFDSHGFRERLVQALEQRPRQVLVAAPGNKRVHLQFYPLTLPQPPGLPLVHLQDPTAEPDSCLVFWGRADSIARTDRYVVTFESTEDRVKLRCWAGPRPERVAGR